MAKPTDMKSLRKHLVAQGFEVIRAKNCHYRVTAPDGRKCQISATPSDHRSLLNSIARLKRIGYQP